MASSKASARSGGSRLRVPPWLATLSGFLGALIGIATNLYSAEFRRLVESASLPVGASTISAVLSAAVASAASVLIYRIFASRQQSMILSKEVRVGADALAHLPEVQDAVAGRTIKYLEAKRKSKELVVLLNGLGLDAADYRAYMAESKYHCVAITMFGFNEEERNDPDYQPAALETQVGLLRYVLNDLFERYPQKRRALVGFSFGADMIMFLAGSHADWLKSTELERVVLLDPNVNQSTLTISSQIAQVDTERPLKQLDRILESATTVAEFRNLCEYLYKITGKSFAQTLRHASDVVAEWPGEEYNTFLDRLGRVLSITDDVYVVLSRSYERHFNEIVRGAQARGLDVGKMETSQGDHFDLIGTRSLKDRLEGVIGS